MNKTYRLKAFITALAFSITCSTSFSLASDNNDYWDGEEYHQHSSSQKDAASDLMKYIPLTGLESILDVGCGDGKITAAISKKLPDGMILGIDISPSMVQFAKNAFLKEEYINLDFGLMGAEDINFDNQFDFILSFTALQWVKDHHLIIKNISKSLKPKGTFAVTMPMGLPMELKLAVDETILDKKWNAYFIDFDTGWNFAEESTYKELLISEGFVTKRAQVVRQEDIFPSLAIFRGFISQWLPYLRPLPSHLREEFMDRVLARYVELEPLDKLGKLHFKINRLEVVSEKE